MSIKEMHLISGSHHYYYCYNISTDNMSQPSGVDVEEVLRTHERCKSVVSTFRTVRMVEADNPLLHWHEKESWYSEPIILVGSMVAQQHFKAHPTDILLATLPKSGTTWTKALLVAITNRDSDNPLANYTHPQDCVPFLEMLKDLVQVLDSLPSPRMLSTHVPYQALPESVLESGVRIVYVWRDPKATFTSYLHFMGKLYKRNYLDPALMEEMFHLFCDGVSVNGPFWDHILGYWKATNKNMLFLKYEDMLKAPEEHVKKLAEFIGKPFTTEEEEQGMVKKIVSLCNLSNLKNLEVMKSNSTTHGELVLDHNSYFRKGEATDWKNHLTPEMAERIDKITEEKFRGSGLAL